jgi:hypothetical protein
MKAGAHPSSAVIDRCDRFLADAGIPPTPVTTSAIPKDLKDTTHFL